MKELITLAAYESFFIFDQVIYIQIDDVAMGSYEFIFISF